MSNPFRDSNIEDIIEEQEKQLIDALSEYDIIYMLNITTTDCTACGLNPIFDEAEDSLCPVCGGEGEIETVERLPLKASIYDRQTVFSTKSSGIIREKFVYIHIEYQDYLNNESYLQPYKPLEIEGTRFLITASEATGIYTKTGYNISLEREDS